MQPYCMAALGNLSSPMEEISGPTIIPMTDPPPSFKTSHKRTARLAPSIIAFHPLEINAWEDLPSFRRNHKLTVRFAPSIIAFHHLEINPWEDLTLLILLELPAMKITAMTKGTCKR